MLSQDKLNNIHKMENNKLETWVDIIGFEGLYQVSDNGNVRSLDVISNRTRGANYKKGKLLKPYNNGRGYLYVKLCKSKEYNIQIHRLVAIHFINNLFNKKEVNHINGIKADNRVENLEWATRSENIKHAIKLGLKQMPYNKGELNPRCKLSKQDVINIRRMCSTGKYMQKDIAIKFNVKSSVVSNIVNLKTWKHI